MWFAINMLLSLLLNHHLLKYPLLCFCSKGSCKGLENGLVAVALTSRLALCVALFR